MKSDADSGSDTLLIYDGHCPFCSRYASYIRLKNTVGNLILIDARENHPVVQDIVTAGYNLDEGMVLKYAGKYYHGSECIHRLALLSTPSNLFNRANALIFKHAWLASLLYPVLRFGRNTALRILGRDKIMQNN